MQYKNTDYNLDIMVSNYNEIKDTYKGKDKGKKIKECFTKEILKNPDFLEFLKVKIGSIPVVFNEEGKASPTLTLKNLNEEQLSIVRLLYTIPRTYFVPSMSKTPQYSRLVPLTLAAIRREQGIKYQDWDKSDEQMKFLLGPGLETVLDSPNLDVDVKDLREHYLTNSKTGEVRISTSFPSKSLPYKDNSQTVNIILAQLWVANAMHRHEDMILDLEDWDNMPEALDETIPIIEEPKKKRENLPW